jgi:hypothetical protein
VPTLFLLTAEGEQRRRHFLQSSRAFFGDMAISPRGSSPLCAHRAASPAIPGEAINAALGHGERVRRRGARSAHCHLFVAPALGRGALSRSSRMRASRFCRARC